MTHTPKKKKRKLPKNIVERDDHDVMERVFGQRAMREIDALVRECSGEKNEQPSSTKE